MSHPFERPEELTAHWRSLAERDGGESFLQQLDTEFAEGADEAPSGLSRRRFLQVMGASIALAGVAGCSWPEEEIVPFGKRPEGYQPGRIARFATTLEFGGQVRPVVVSSYDGRPIKVEGNPEHPLSLGATDAWAQASILDLYDPDRSRSAFAQSSGFSVEASAAETATFLSDCRAALADGSRVAFVSTVSTSPALGDMRRRLGDLAPRARWYGYDPLSRGNEDSGFASCGLSNLHQRTDLSDARVIVDLEADLLATHAVGVRNARDFARRRKPDGAWMNRLYSFEASMSVTGATADHRVAVPSQSIASLLILIADALRSHGQLADPGAIESALSMGYELGAARRAVELGPMGARALEVLDAVVDDLEAHPAESLIAVGRTQPAVVHALALAINTALGSVGHTVHLHEITPVASDGGLVELSADLHAGEIDAIYVMGCNPVYDAPADLDFGSAYETASRRVHLGTYRDETAMRSRFHIPMAHALESWGDVIAPDGSSCSVQPLIEPLFGGRSPIELLSELIDPEPLSGHAIVRRRFGLSNGLDALPDPILESRWAAFLHDGFEAGTPVAEAPSISFAPELADQLRAWVGAAGTDLELVVTFDAKVFDGRFANNAWLQELPDPISKLTWDNVAMVSMALARDHGFKDGDVVRLDRGTASIELPVIVQPGQSARSISVAAGYGRESAGRVGDGVGARVWDLVESSSPYHSMGISIEKTGRRVDLACTQDHYMIDPRGRAERESRVGVLAREGTIEEFRSHPEFVEHRGIHHPPLESLWDERDWSEGPQWGMAIDLNACTGCSACVTACQAENNIPTVGRDQVIRGREMHWLRMDRYFQGDPENPAVIQQPVACAQCELAPCEGVCPVGATMHSAEGLNVMAYNRCVGTRYCANNCPYKVRRFNFFDLQKSLTKIEELAFNPEVTIRSRGVMEKCTYCVQRIEHARINAKNQRRPMRDGDVVTACQQTCPTEAIYFGDLSDPDSAVSKAQADARAYALLGELNLKPRTFFMAKLRNPHPRLAAAHEAAQDSGHESDQDGAAHGATETHG